MPTDPFSTFSHLAGALVAVICGVALIRRARPDAGRVIAMGVFVASAVTLLLASATFHAVPAGSAARGVTQRLDHAAIFVLIAGTFTPLHVILFRGVLRWGVLGFVWAAAVAGIVVKTVYFASVPEWAGVGAYLALGWVGALSMVLVSRRCGVRFVSPLVLGGLAYTVGALCELTGQPTIITGVVGSHEVFHVAVLVGLGCMWMFIRRIAPGVPEMTVAGAIGGTRSVRAAA
ncbi:MAG: hemolysin III [Phycisphaeraceae bacterium]|nr:MAG: hemolysin III [Phycisphaeraceae bacterium]